MSQQCCDQRSLGKIILLNGTPRAGKSSIVSQIQETFPGIWVNLGVDCYMAMTPKHLLPGIGLRPGGERPDLEPAVETMYLALYAAIAAQSRMGVNVVADVGHHDWYQSLEPLFPRCLKLLEGLPVTVVGVECPLEEILKRREATGYPARDENGQVLEPIQRWQDWVHKNKTYHMVVDTARLSPEECAQQIYKAVFDSEPTTL
ncbi:MAG: phosphotransferase-like protein [Massiliimalia sp.]